MSLVFVVWLTDVCIDCKTTPILTFPRYGKGRDFFLSLVAAGEG